MQAFPLKVFFPLKLFFPRECAWASWRPGRTLKERELKACRRNFRICCSRSPRITKKEYVCMSEHPGWRKYYPMQGIHYHHSMRMPPPPHGSKWTANAHSASHKQRSGFTAGVRCTAVRVPGPILRAQPPPGAWPQSMLAARVPAALRNRFPDVLQGLQPQLLRREAPVAQLSLSEH